MTLVIFKAISGSTRWEKWRLSRSQRRVASHAICNFSSFFIKMRPHLKHSPHPHFSLMTRLPIPLPLQTPLISPQSSNLARYHSSIVKVHPRTFPKHPTTQGSGRRRKREHRRRTRRQQQRVRFRFRRRQTRWLHVGDPQWMGFRSVILNRSPQNDYTGTRARGRGKKRCSGREEEKKRGRQTPTRGNGELAKLLLVVSLSVRWFRPLQSRRRLRSPTNKQDAGKHIWLPPTPRTTGGLTLIGLPPSAAQPNSNGHFRETRGRWGEAIVLLCGRHICSF